MTNEAINAELAAALLALLDWARDNTSPSDANSPHELLITAADVLKRAGA